MVKKYTELTKGLQINKKDGKLLIDYNNLSVVKISKSMSEDEIDTLLSNTRLDASILFTKGNTIVVALNKIYYLDDEVYLGSSDWYCDYYIFIRGNELTLFSSGIEWNFDTDETYILDYMRYITSLDLDYNDLIHIIDNATFEYIELKDKSAIYVYTDMVDCDYIKLERDSTGKYKLVENTNLKLQYVKGQNDHHYNLLTDVKGLLDKKNDKLVLIYDIDINFTWDISLYKINNIKNFVGTYDLEYSLGGSELLEINVYENDIVKVKLKNNNKVYEDILLNGIDFNKLQGE